MHPFLVFVFFGIAFCQQLVPYPVNETISSLNASLLVPYFTFTANVVNMSRLEVNSTPSSNLILCFQEQYKFPEPTYNNNSQYWSTNGICSFFVLANGHHTQEIPLLNIPYVVSVFFQNATGVTVAPQVQLKIGTMGDSCPMGEVSRNATVEGCVNTTSLHLNTVIEAKQDMEEVYLFQLSNMFITGKFTIECLDNTSKLDFKLKRDGSPSASDAMLGNCSSPITLPNPRNGLHGYYLLVQNKENQTVNFTVRTTECHNQTGGPNCEYSVLNASTTPTLMLEETMTYYFRINATINNPVWVSVRRVNGTFTDVVNPYIFASLNQLPSVNNADIGGCNQFYCQYVNVIKFNVSENQTWYVGIQNSEAFYNGSIAGVWFNSVCAPECQDHGTCADSGPQMGFCDCIDGFIGVDCQTQNGFGPQFIVLIIIAVLVALTAVIGFGAWAYMRRKRGQYDLVS